MSEITSLRELTSRDVLNDLQSRIAEIKAKEGVGYGPCLAFYERLEVRILKGDSDMQFMVEKIADDTLPAYREQGEKMLMLAMENERLTAELERSKSDAGWAADAARENAEELDRIKDDW